VKAREAHSGDLRPCCWRVAEEPFPVRDEPEYLYVPIEWVTGGEDTLIFHRDEEIEGLVRMASVS
jgi:hypothetical protein